VPDMSAERRRGSPLALQLLACLGVSLIFGCSQYGAPAIRCADRETIAGSIRAGGELETRDVFVGETYDARFWLANEGDMAVSFCFLYSLSIGYGYLREEEGAFFPVRLSGLTMHTRCADRTDLDVGERMLFEYKLPVPELPVESAELVSFYTLRTVPECRGDREEIEVEFRIPVAIHGGEAPPDPDESP